MAYYDENTFDITQAELDGANRGQRPDLLADPKAIYRLPNGTLYQLNAEQLTADVTQPALLRSVNGIPSLADGAGNSFLRGTVTSGSWMTVPTIFRLRITGTGTLQMDSKDSLGNITLSTFPLTTYAAATDSIEFPYAGDDAVAIRVTLTGTLTCEVI